MKWQFLCPICHRNVINGYEVDEVKDYIGATYDCPECGGVLKIKSDLTVDNFAAKLENIFSDMINTETKKRTSIYDSWLEYEAKDTGVNIMGGEQNDH